MTPARWSVMSYGFVTTFFWCVLGIKDLHFWNDHLYLPCDLEDSGARNSSPISREIDHP